MTPDKDKKFILDNISVTPQMVAQAREFILKNFDKNTRTLIENFLWNIEASLDNNKVFLRKDNPEPGLKKVAEHISWRLAACRAIKDMIRSNELSQDPKYQGPKYLDDGIPRIHWEKKDPSGSGMGSVWDFDEISIDIPLYVKLPFPYAHGQQAVKKDEPSVPAGGSMDKRKVFVVHGRSEKANKALFEFLRAIDLRPLEWGEAIKLTKKGSPYLGEIVEAGLSHTQATVVLLTGDDDVRLKKDFIKDDDPDHEKNLTPQPRPNVLLEAGMAFGKHPERTILVKLGTIREISDITGRYEIRMNDSPEKRNELAQRLEDAGCPVNRSGQDWLRAGDFKGVNQPHKATDSHKEASSNNDYDDNITNEQLQDEYINILSVFTQLRGPLYESYIADIFSISIHKAKYFLEKLTKKGYVNAHSSYIGETTYSLSENGREFLFKKGLL